MFRLLRFVRNACGARKGATAIEYGLLAALLAMATLGTLQTLGTTLNTGFNNLGSSVQNAG
ncbi:MAG TPA: Flp family type IVb pilin [Stellaceae bacterium]|nr:Flp family type IVb pilin [Stellaceae bacterium]